MNGTAGREQSPVRRGHCRWRRPSQVGLSRCPPQRPLFLRRRQKAQKPVAGTDDTENLLSPDMRHPEHLEARMVEDMKAAGLDSAFIYAFEKTGLPATEQNQHLIPN